MGKLEPPPSAKKPRSKVIPVSAPVQPPPSPSRVRQDTGLRKFWIALAVLVVVGGGSLLVWSLPRGTPTPGATVLAANSKNGESPAVFVPPAPTDSVPEETLPPQRKIPVAVTPPLVRPASFDEPLDLFQMPKFKSTKVGPKVPGFEQRQIDEAIDRGVQFLRNTQTTWLNHRGHTVGYAALPGLTLLECGVPANDPLVQKAARIVREHVPSLNQTYDLALAILFLDRLGNPEDRANIQALAVRLIAGQMEGGGWTYTCPIISAPDTTRLITYLGRTKLHTATMDPFKTGQFTAPFEKPQTGTSTGPNGATTTTPLPTPPLATTTTTIKPGEPGYKATTGPTTAPDGSSVPATVPAGTPAKPGDVAAVPANPPIRLNSDTPLLKPNIKLNPATLPSTLQRIPAVTFDVTKFKGAGGGDNSNTQFAMLGLWAAKRHGVATERSLILADRRFSTSQNSDGGWGYHVSNPTKPAMTGVGLLGLAMGHGSKAKSDLPAATAADPGIQRGLAAFGRYIGQPVDAPTKSLRMENLYLLWSIERVAMLYNLNTIGSKDWYAWGAQILLVNQAGDGHWISASYPGAHSPAIDTSFALLFLKRSNLVQDLSENLRLLMVVTDPGVK